MIDILQGEVQFILVMLQVAAILSPPIGQHSEHRDLMLFKERQHAVVE